MHSISITSQRRQQIIDLTGDIQKFLDKNKYKDGILTVYRPHTTAGISVNENADPDVKRDISAFLSLFSIKIFNEQACRFN